MNSLPNPFKQLVERKLWPIALLLAVALVAVPFLLKKKDDTPVPSATTTAAAGASATLQDAVVSQADAAKTDKVRAVLGDRKDPFRPAQIHVVATPTPNSTAQPNQGTAPGDTSGTSSSSGGGAPAGGGGATTTTPSTGPAAPTATPTAAPTFDLYSLTVRFGSTDSDQLVTKNLKRLTGLPGGENPAVLYLGLTGDHKSAVFIVDASVQALGDGKCAPSPDNCQTLTLKKGQTEFITRGSKQWELDLVDIHTKKTGDAREATLARAAVAKGGKRALRSLLGRTNHFTYDQSTGTVRKMTKAEIATASARMAKRSAQVAAFTPSP